MKIVSAYHLYGKPGNSEENSNGTVHFGGSFPEKKVIPFELLPFPVLTETIEIFYTICLDYQCKASCREKKKKLPVFCKWYYSAPFLFSVPKKILVPFDGNFSLKFPYKW